MPRRSKKTEKAPARKKDKNTSSQTQKDDDDRDKDYTPSQSQLQSQPHLSSNEINQLAGEVCNLLLVSEMKKIPIKSAVIKKSILNKKVKSFNSVMEKAGEIMEHVFGYKIVLLKSSGYILVNTLEQSHLSDEYVSDEEGFTRGCLLAILIGIFMSEGKMSAGSLNTYLDVLDVDSDTAKSLLLDFIKKKYLVMVTEDSTDPPTTLYTWGDRAHAEFSKKDILEYACKIYGKDMKPSMWTYQYREANKENGSEANKETAS